jgi:hypothetical protein
MSFVIGSVTLDMGVSSDTGWITEEVASEQHPIGSSSTLYQSDGFKSPVRTLGGVTKSASIKHGLDTQFAARANINLTDHLSNSYTVRIVELTWDEQMDITNLGTGTFKFQIKVMKR